MKNIIKNNTEDLKYKYLGSGSFGDCYLTRALFVYKEFNSPAISNIYDSMSYLCNHNNESFLFPISLVYMDEIERENLRGYIRKYVSGVELSKMPLNTSMYSFLDALSILEKDTKSISKDKIKINDLKDANAFYNINNRIKVLDTDFYGVLKSTSFEELYKLNLMELEYLISRSIIKQNALKFKNNSLIEYFEKTSEGKMLPSDYLNEIIDEIENASKEEVHTYKEFNEGLSLIMKKH